MQQQAADSEKHAPTTTATTTEAVPVTTEEASKEPVEQVKPGSNFKFTPIQFDAPTDAEKTAAAAKAKSEAEKRMERAKRFGVPVKEEVKKDLRAQKFGEADKKSPTTTPAAPASKPSQVSDTKLILCSAEGILI
jgi:SAP domain-containing ribonucleoprotein